MVSAMSIIEPFWAGFETLTEKLGSFLSFPNLIVLLGIFSLVWPVVLTLIIAMATASTWVFWLVITFVVGIMQFVYVAYQMTMISFDIMILAFLKTCAVLRSRIRHYTFMNRFSKRYLSHKRNVSSRHEWKRKLKEANCYETFTQIEIEEPFPTPLNEESTSAWGDSIRNILERNSSKITQIAKKNIGPKNDYAKFKKSFKNIISSTNKKNNIARTKSCVDLDHATIASDESRMIRAVSSNTINKPYDQYKNGLEKELGMVAEMIRTTTVRLEEARLHAISSTAKKNEDGFVIERNENEVEDAISSLEFLLSGVMKRNHLNIENLLIKDSRSVVESGRYAFSKDARDLILNYNKEVESCLKCLAEIDILREKKQKGINESPNSVKKNKKNDILGTDSMDQFDTERRVLTERIQVMRKVKHNMGRTALMLSGGGAQSMYHLGTIKALIESNTYDDIKVISGTSGGSITAAICALHTDEELLRDVCVPTVSTDYRLNGQMKRENIRWFPTVVNMGRYWLEKRLLVDSKEFKRCCDFYYGDATFEEAFEKTGKHVCITVSASRAGEGGSGVQRLLLNHISTPHVTLASAVAASSALPGVMAPAKLITKNKNGKKDFFEVDGVEWIDGSVKADLPFKRISTLFNVSNFIVCQTNFHVLPFLNKEHHPNVQSLYWQIFQNCEWDIRSRALHLSRLGLFPKIFGQDMSKVFKQKYHGNLTLVPRFTTMQVFGLKSLVNPTVEDMKIYLKNGQAAAWPYLIVIKEMLRLESTIEKSLIRLDERLRSSYSEPEFQSMDDVESIISRSSFRENSYNLFAAQEMESMKQKLSAYELENMSLRKKIEQLSERKKDV